MEKIISGADLKSIGFKEGKTIGKILDISKAPMAYKDINKVMDAQQALVDVVTTFTPKLVRMADDGSRED